MTHLLDTNICVFLVRRHRSDELRKRVEACTVGALGISAFRLRSFERPLAFLPGAVLAVLVPFRPTERYGLVAVDGALLAGALLAIAL